MGYPTEIYQQTFKLSNLLQTSSEISNGLRKCR